MQNRQVPQIAQLRQQISRANLGPVQSPLMQPVQPNGAGGYAPVQSPLMPRPKPILGSAQQPYPDQALIEQVQELAISIYSDLAVAHIQHNPHATHPQMLKDLAQSAQQAALAYFEALGVQFDTPPKAG